MCGAFFPSFVGGAYLFQLVFRGRRWNSEDVVELGIHNISHGANRLHGETFCGGSTDGREQTQDPSDGCCPGLPDPTTRKHPNTHSETTRHKRPLNLEPNKTVGRGAARTAAWGGRWRTVVPVRGSRCLGRDTRVRLITRTRVGQNALTSR